MARRPETGRLVATAAVVGALLLVLVGARVLAGAVGGTSRRAVAPGVPVSVEIPIGASAKTIGALLDDAGVVDAGAFRQAARRRGVAGELRAGRYELETGMEPDAVVDALLAGPAEPSASTVTIVEGWRLDEVLDVLGERTPFSRAEYEAALRSGAVTSPFLPDELPDGVDPLVGWEGLLFPAKYEISPGDTPATILQRMADELEHRMAAEDWSRLGELGVDRYEALIVASLVEQEAKLDRDRPLIASVIYNRLAKGMRLQINATVVYAKETATSPVTGDDFHIDSPYNTYLVDGLPPTPIGTVGQASLDAAAHPATTDYLYYVLVSKDGAHGFSTTLEEHRAKIAKAKADGVLP